MGEKCRLCLQTFPKGSGVSIKSAQLEKELEDVFCNVIVYDDQLPKYVCKECRNEVSYIHSFCQQILANQQQLMGELKDVLSQSDEEIIYDTQYVDDLLPQEEKEIKQEVMVIEKISIQYDQSIDSTLSDDGASSSQVNSGKEDASLHEEEQYGNKKEQAKKFRTTRLENEKIIQDFFKLQCEICSASLKSFESVLHHYREKHQTDGYVRCCEKQYFIRSCLVDHIGAHLGSIRCEICQKSYKTKRYLQQHMTESHSPAEDRPFKCTECHMSYSKEHLLRAHMQRHVKQQCPVCQKILSNQNSLKVHIAQVHSSDANQICDTCGKVFRTKPAMERHIKLDHQPQLVIWQQCEWCEKWFDCKQNLKKHIRLIHDQSGSFPCDQCDHKSITRRALLNHKNRTHKQKQLFECELCGKTLNTKLVLREHMATHSKVPLYSCAFCDTKFNSNANKYKHYKNKHFKKWEEMKRQKLLNKISIGTIQC
ncbi:transcription factor grauzone-like [Anopheles maculipalpis]|uniref:transcription factor grauzone-like n=1 Tax=Anopheles maculipalpis TaxID=1496333 RepID=UPI00215925F8|nr:transcription factor grauzone-like [Anopheles maculipalpis]